MKPSREPGRSRSQDSATPYREQEDQDILVIRKVGRPEALPTPEQERAIIKEGFKFRLCA